MLYYYIMNCYMFLIIYQVRLEKAWEEHLKEDEAKQKRAEEEKLAEEKRLAEEKKAQAPGSEQPRVRAAREAFATVTRHAVGESKLRRNIDITNINVFYLKSLLLVHPILLLSSPSGSALLGGSGEQAMRHSAPSAAGRTHDAHARQREEDLRRLR